MFFGFRSQDILDTEGEETKVVPMLGTIGLIKSDTACVAEYLAPIDE